MDVTRFAKVIVVVVLALWGLATMHCDLEDVPGFEFLASCHGQAGYPQQGNDCNGDGCSVVESGPYKVGEFTPTMPLPVWVVNFVLPLWDPTPPVIFPYTSLPNDSSPELPRVWQFSYRTALPPRAPSFLA